jgi:hypothetical protein
MKQTIELEFEVTVKAVMRGEEEPHLSVTLSLPYGSGRRSVSITEDQFAETELARVKEALKAASALAVPIIFAKAQAAAAQALEVAIRNQEEV